MAYASCQYSQLLLALAVNSASYATTATSVIYLLRKLLQIQNEGFKAILVPPSKTAAIDYRDYLMKECKLDCEEPELMIVVDKFQLDLLINHIYSKRNTGITRISLS